MGKLRLITGPSGSGKSTYLYKEIIERAGNERDRNFFFIVPDQSAMNVQKDLVSASPQKGILNIDVLGFGRLSHRILEETGQEEIPVLDDTGMSLILQKVASGAAKDLPYLGAKLGMSGYISEVKSAISEFMQYGISPSGMDELIDLAVLRGSLKSKLKDIRKIYELFEEYISGHYITREEKLDILCEAIPESSLLPDSVMVFDGFTGFTPVQMKVIGALMKRCSEVIVTLESSEGEDVRTEASIDSLFYLSHKTAAGLIKLAEEAGLEISEPEMKNCLIGNRDIALLEANLFRNNKVRPEGTFEESVRIFEMADPSSEARYTGVKIRELIEKQGYAYRDFGVICGNAEMYAPYFERYFADMEIPFFMDSVSKVMLNPLVETVLAVLDIEVSDYSPESVTRFLKGGLTGIDSAETDLIDNYIRQTGVRGSGAWHNEFTRKIKGRREDKEYLEKVNAIRKKVIAITGLLENGGKRILKGTADDYVKRLYDMLESINASDQLKAFKEKFDNEGNKLKSQEYKYVWKQMVDLIDKVYLLIGNEEVTIDSFADIMSAGIGEMRVPVIPLNVDRVQIGDIVRSRLTGVKVLFIVGANDGNIPQVSSSKGLISDLDREFLSEQGIELAPTPAQEMFIQRQYLYMNICKPSEMLFVSYSRVRTDGKSTRPSYLIPVIKKILPYTAKVIRPEELEIWESVAGKKDAAIILSRLMREYADTGMGEEKDGSVFALYASLDGERVRDDITDSVYKRYLDNPLADDVVEKLYPEMVEGSVSSLETYAGCPYRYFLNFTLQIKPTESFEIESSDAGSLAHDILKSFSDRLSVEGLSWTTFTDEYAKSVIPDIAYEKSASFGSSLYYASKRNEYNISRLSRLALRSVLFIREQLKAGSFVPTSFEKPFNMDIDLENGRKLRMRGIIDRVDIATEGDKKYVQVVDYKSGDKDIDLSMLMDGRQIQIPLYMYKEKEDTGAEPAAMIYFHIQDPLLDVKNTDALEKIDKDRISKLKPKGEMSSDPGALKMLDSVFEGMNPKASSDFYPVTIKNDGCFDQYSRVLPPEVMQMILDEAVSVVKKEAIEITEGRISVKPYRSACKYCPYLAACGMDPKIPGYKTADDKKLKRKETIEELMKKYGKEDGKGGDE